MHLMKRFLPLLMLCWATVAVGQTRYTLEGSVRADDGQPLPGATLLVEGTTLGAATGLDGNFRFTVAGPRTVTIIASFVGFASERQTLTLASEETVTLSFTLRPDALGFEDVIVTGVANAGSKLESSVSVTSLQPAGIQQAVPRSTAEIFRAIPGIRSEASGGDGNTNITVRGVPISAGGSKYLQLQEDGLPILLFGDIAFATADIFLRADGSLGRLEAIRGGSASTLASNSPAGIINFISQTGTTAGGTVAMTSGLDYRSQRLDFGFGSPLDEHTSFFVGGFFRSGEGPRETGYVAERGGQIKANLTRRFDSGYARLHLKMLDDRTPAYMPQPMQVTGTNADPSWASAPGMSATRQVPHSVYLLHNFGIGAEGQRRRVSVADGMHPQSNAIGAEFAFDLGDGWTVESRTRYAQNRGRFVAPFPATVGSTSAMLTEIGNATGRNLAGATLSVAHTGQPFTGANATIIHLFDTELENFDNLFSDTRLTYTLLPASGREVNLTAGVFRGMQRIKMSWLWNSFLMDVNGSNAALLDITTAAGERITQSGLFAYGVPVWGNCCQVGFDATYDVTAPYVNLGFRVNEGLTVEASARLDFGVVSGSGAGTAVGPLDVNNDGVISPVEQAVATIDNAQRNPVDYTYDYLSFSVGANQMVGARSAVFGRFSRGASAKADRAIFPSGRYVAPISFGPKDVIDQAELGWKQQFRNGGLFLTGFYAATTEEGGFEATTQRIVKNDYRAFGVEVEGTYDFREASIRGAITYTSAEITSGSNEGNTPRRQPALMYNLLPSYKVGAHEVGLSLIGQTKAYAQDNNQLVMPGYLLVNGFVNLSVSPALTLSLGGNNLLDAIGITESEEGAIVDGTTNWVRARSVTGRSVSATLRYTF